MSTMICPNIRVEKIPWGGAQPVSHQRAMLLGQLQQTFVQGMWLDMKQVAHKGQWKGTWRVLPPGEFDEHQVRLGKSNQIFTLHVCDLDDACLGGGLGTQCKKTDRRRRSTTGAQRQTPAKRLKP